LRKRVLILHTGGTLGMAPREPDRVLAPAEFGTALAEHVPELSELAEVETRVLCNLDSSDVGPEHWMRLAHETATAFARFDGVVITHGTDTMAYSASALSFVLRNPPRPVILTGSQRPLAQPHSDARGNLVGAVDLATRDIPEVAVYFHGWLLRGNRTSKTSSFAYRAFRSPNCTPLAQVGTDVRLHTPALEPRGPFRVEGAFDPRVAVLRVVPGQDGTALAVLAQTDTRAVLLEAFGVGNIPVEDRSFGDGLRRLAAAGKIIAVGSQSAHGGVDLSRYPGGRLAEECGAVGIGDMTIEAATVKLMYLLGGGADADEVRRRLLEPLAGELT